METRRQRQPRAAQNGDHEGRQAEETRQQRQEQPRMEIMKGDKLGRQSGSGSQGQPRMEMMKTSLGDKAAAASRPLGNVGDQQPSH